MRAVRICMFAFGVLLGVASLPVIAQPLDILWVRRYAYNYWSDTASDVDVDGAGNIYVLGMQKDNLSTSAVLLKYSPEGSLLWSLKQEIAPAYSGASVVDVEADEQGSVCILAGDTYYAKYTIFKYDTDGNLLWTHSYAGGSSGSASGGPSALTLDAQGNVIATGSTGGYWSGPDITTVKYAGDGRPLWVRRYSRSASQSVRERGTSVATSPAGDVYVCGISSDASWTGVTTWVTMCYDARGNQRWVQTEEVQGESSILLARQPIVLYRGDSLYVIGTSRGKAVVIKYTPEGTRLWRYEHTVPEYTLYFAGAALDEDGNVYMAIDAAQQYGYPLQRYVLLLKVSSDGNLVWLRQRDPSKSEVARCMTRDARGNLWVFASVGTGYSSPTPILVAQYSATGELLFEQTFISSSEAIDTPLSVSADEEGNVVVAVSSQFGNPPWTGMDIVTLKIGETTGVRFSGKVWLGDTGIIPPGMPVEVELRQNGHAVRRDVVYLDETGRFILYNAPQGVYDLAFRGMHWLRRVVPQVTIAPDAPEVEVYLVNGDIDGDNEVTLFDFALLVQAFGSDPYDANWNINADLDVDAEVTLFDFAVIVFNFGEVGDE